MGELTENKMPLGTSSEAGGYIWNIRKDPRQIDNADEKVRNDIRFFQMVFSYYLEQVFEQISEENYSKVAAETLAAFCRAMISDYKFKGENEYVYQATECFLKYERSIKEAAGFEDDFDIFIVTSKKEREKVESVCGIIPFGDILDLHFVLTDTKDKPQDIVVKTPVSLPPCTLAQADFSTKNVPVSVGSSEQKSTLITKPAAVISKRKRKTVQIARHVSRGKPAVKKQLLLAAINMYNYGIGIEYFKREGITRRNIEQILAS